MSVTQIVSLNRTATRPTIVGPETPEPPYPLYSAGDVDVIAGFGRGSSDLGIPTANIPREAYVDMLAAIKQACGHDTGIYYGWVAVSPNPPAASADTVAAASSEKTVTTTNNREIKYNFGTKLEPGVDTGVVLPMVMSVGLNPFYHNQDLSAEIHIIHKFHDTFYGAKLRFIVLGYIRPELDYVSVEALIDDINFDIKVALNSLARPDYAKLKCDAFFKQ
jgi:riboflavin kinase